MTVYYINVISHTFCFHFRTKIQRERERDISEQIALGLPAKTNMGGEGQFDQRLFNGTKGMDSGFGDDESYNVYDKPWRNTAAQHIYRPSKNIDKEIDFSSERVPERSGPVQFERPEEDPFGLDQFLTQAKRAPKRSREEKPRGEEKRKRN